MTIGRILPVGGRGRLPLILQAEAAECGLACLAMISAYHGRAIDLNTLRRRHPVSMKGATLSGLIQVARQLQMAARPLSFELDDLTELRLPAIVHWDLEHFVVLKKVTRRGIVVHDPASGPRQCTFEEASKHLTGIALELVPAADFVERDERRRLPLSSFWARTQGARPALLQVLVLSILLEAFAVAAPFYMQLAVDEVIVRGDADLMLAIALGFGMLAVITSASAALRSYILLLVQNLLGVQMGADLFRHLLRLPLAWFERRHVGDVLSRFGSTEPIRDLLAQGAIAALIDGAMAAATLAMIFAYSPTLALIAVGALVLYAAVHVACHRAYRNRSEAEIRAKADENSAFLETVRGVQGIKLSNCEAEREGQWLNRISASADANIRVGSIKIGLKTANDVVFGLENILAVYLGAQLVMAGDLTVGMLFAYLGYKRHFVEKSALLVQKLQEFRALGLHLERLGDIALSDPEPGHERPLSYARPLAGRIELKNVSFRYAEGESFVLADLSLAIEPGEYVTIAGPSGGGKTTLVKVMLGLLEPTAGEVLIDGVPLPAFGHRVYREQVAAVMQDDSLLSGTIADNICSFASGFDGDWMIRCAQAAAIHEEIMAMPMAYNTLIGDMGSSLSGGQKQRILLARALYRRPRVLFLDEGTAHLDVDTERQINKSLKELDITRISVAHRPETMKAADRVVMVGRGYPGGCAPQA